MHNLSHGSASRPEANTRPFPGFSETPEAPEPFRPNVILVMVDDAGMAQFSAYDEENLWPADYVYAPMPWLDSLVQSGVRYTQYRVAARCTPTRACVMTGRHAHVSPTHEGNGMGDIQTPPFEQVGLNPDHWPFPRVATELGTPYAMAHFGKFHLSATDTFFNSNPRGTVDQGHFPEAWEHRLVNGGAQAPSFGYENFPENIVTPTSLVEQTIDGVFLESHTAQRVMDWIAGRSPGEPFFVQWWMNEIHSKLPALQPDAGPGGATLHSLLSFEQQAPAAKQADGTGDPEFPCNVLWRRALANLEAVDSLCALVDASMTPEQRANTLWVFCSDNGVHGSDIIPFADSLHSAPPQSWSVLPPTRNDTVTGRPFHDPEHAKATLYEGGCRVPLVIGGPALPSAGRGTVNASMLEAVDLYPTLLDILAPDWRSFMDGEGVLQHVDGLSFIETLAGGTGPRRIAFSHVYRPQRATLGNEIWFQRKAVDDEGFALLWRFSREAGGSSEEAFELYDLNEDPDERVDLFPTVGQDPVATEHFNRLKAHIDVRLDL